MSLAAHGASLQGLCKACYCLFVIFINAAWAQGLWVRIQKLTERGNKLNKYAMDEKKPSWKSVIKLVT